MHPLSLKEGKSCVSVAIGLIAEYYTTNTRPPLRKSEEAVNLKQIRRFQK